MRIAAALRGEAQLQLCLLAVCYPGVDVGPVHPCSVAVSAFFDDVAQFVVAYVFQHEHVTQVGVEAFHQHVGLPMSEAGGPVHRTAVAVGAFLAQSVGQFDLHALAAHGRYVQVFVVGLWGAESRGVCQACLQVVCRFIEQVHAGADDEFFYQVVFVQAQSGKERQLFHLPLILHECAGYAYLLFHVAVVSGHDVVQGVVLVFQSTRKGGRGKEAVVHVAHIHAARHCRQVVGRAVGVHVALRAVVAVAVGVLHGGIERHLVFVFSPEQVVAQSSAVDDVLGLLGDVGLVGLQVELVASPPEFVRGVIFQADAAEEGGAVIRPESEGVHVQLAQFRESVAVAVVRIAVAVAFVQGDAIRVVLGHERYVGTHVLLPRLSVHVGEGARHLERVADGVFRDDVDGASHGIGPEQGRTSSAHHLDTLYHVDRYLFEPIHPAQCADDGPAVDEYLRIRPFQSVDAHLREAAVLAVILHAQSRLEVERLGEVGGVHRFKQLGTHHVHHHGGILAVYLVAVGGHHHFVRQEAFFLHQEVHHGGIVLVYAHFLLLRLVSHERDTQSVRTFRQSGQGELPFFVRYRALSRAHNEHRGIGYVFFRALHDDMAGNHVAFFHGFRLSRVCHAGGECHA